MKKIISLDPKTPYTANIISALMSGDRVPQKLIIIAMDIREAAELIYEEFGEDTTDILSIEKAGEEVYLYDDE